MSEWINVRNKLPDEGAEVLVFNVYLKIKSVIYTKKRGFHAMAPITHWMPLPTPPKENKHDY